MFSVRLQGFGRGIGLVEEPLYKGLRSEQLGRHFVRAEFGLIFGLGQRHHSTASVNRFEAHRDHRFGKVKVSIIETFRIIEIIFICFSNLIRDFDAISFLFLCSKLDSLTLRGNPIEEDPEYRDIVKRYLPGLRLLDPKSSSSVQRVAKGTCRTKTRDEGDRDTDDEHDGKDSLVVKKGIHCTYSVCRI